MSANPLQTLKHKCMKKNLPGLHTFRFGECRKKLISMKILAIFMLVGAMQAAAGVYSQSVLLSLELKGHTLGEALDMISEQSGVVFFYSSDLIDDRQTVTYRAEDLPLEVVLSQLLAGKNIEHAFYDNYVVLTAVPVAAGHAEVKNPVPSDRREITGKVVDGEDNLPIPGASVYVKGSTIGTITDLDGNFSLRIPSDARILVFSMMGMETVEEVIGGRDIINAVLYSARIGLDEVVVVGYGTQLRREMTGSISSIQSEDLATIPSPTFESALAGQTAGVFVGQNSGRLGEAFTIRIRGASSVSASNQPLYVIDGMPVTSQTQGSPGNHPTNPLSDINPNDIESIQILKDASAAAIYGSRASNGVVLITTKRGKTGETRFNVNMSSGINQAANLRDWLNASEYLELIDEALEYATDDNGLIWGWTTPDGIKDVYIPGWRDGHNEDWQREALQTGIQARVNFSAAGGTENTRFYAGITYDDQDGIIIGNSLERISGRLNLDQSVGDNFLFGMSTNFVRTLINRVENDNAWANPMQLVALPPVQPVIDPQTGEYNTRTVYYNSLINYRDASNLSNVYRTLLNAYGEYNILENFSFRTELGTDILNQNEKTFYGRRTNWGSPNGLAEERNVHVLNYNLNSYFTFRTDIGNNHHVSVVAGMAAQKSTSDGSFLQGRGFPTDDFKNMRSAAEITGYDGWGFGHSYLSYFSRANYKFMDRYLVGLSARVDGSSRFGADNRYGFFPSVSAGWIMTDESFLKEAKHLSFLKMRASYGLTGNSEIGNYEALGLFRGVSYPGYSGLLPSQLRSPDLRWETTSQLDIGIDFAFFNDRLSGQMDYYHKETKDLLLRRSLPATSGYTSVTRNVGSLRNYGWEFSIRSHNLRGGPISWVTDFNISFNRNKVLNIDGPEIAYGVNYVIEGEEIGVFKIPEYAGVHPMTGDALFYKNDGSGQTTTNYNEAQRVIVGSPNPSFLGGLSNSITYGAFDLNILFNFVYGNDVYLSGGRYQSANGEWWDNQTRDQLDRWQKPGDITDVPQARFDQRNGSQHSSRYLYDGSYLRLRSVNLGYNLPPSLTARGGFSQARIFVTGYNLLTFTRYPGYDPDVNSLGTGTSAQASNVVMGIDFYTTPQIRSVLFGIDLSF
ncbi:MAG: SusC/RagA family TonB-linked outer membrane protein [Bacteroidia bacterium]|nr:MAG: SusC/RagA family TonB-linked outer membrane protein [Bacteroidia bacterium]